MCGCGVVVEVAEVRGGVHSVGSLKSVGRRSWLLDIYCMLVLGHSLRIFTQVIYNLPSLHLSSLALIIIIILLFDPWWRQCDLGKTFNAIFVDGSRRARFNGERYRHSNRVSCCQSRLE